ncbi:MAG: hypothetical protein H0T41_12290 [Rhodobacteraceae bacterium]|nr:hypothetical protein [Paracoccaceae bacterium]
MPNSNDEARNAAQLRAAIDRGDAGDKAMQGDPAAAPLGTDDEAAGTPNSARQVESAMKQEVRARSRDGGENATATIPVAASVGAHSETFTLERLAPWLAMIGVVAVVLLIYFAMTYLGLLT